MVKELMGTPLNDKEREKYAPPGSMIRKALEDGLVDWPTKEEVEYENLSMDLLSGATVTLELGPAQATGRRRVLEFSLDGGWRIAFLPEIEINEQPDTMGAPEFPLPTDEGVEKVDPWISPVDPPAPPHNPVA